MKYTEITTPQNVTIRYTLATFWERAIATIIDGVVLSILIFLLSTLIFSFDNSDVHEILMAFIIVPVVLFYSLLFEIFNKGQSIGKKLLSLRVIRMDAEPLRFSDFLMRWVFRGVEIYFSLGTISMFSVIASSRNQRIGDLLGNTIVVNVSRRDRLSIENLLSLEKTKEKKVKYPAVVKLPEETILVLRETLNKRKQYQNEAHNRAAQLLVDRLCIILELEKPKNNDLFLQTLLSDYVVLTR